jgi:hypothetical protein
VYFWAGHGRFSGEIPDAELYLRATAMACFCPIMQYHSEFNHHRHPSRDRTPWNIADRTGTASVLSTFREFAQLRETLVPYLVEQAHVAVATGRPLMRPLFVDHADETVWDWPWQYQLGDDLLVAPVVEPGVTEWPVYLPAGTWQDFFTGEVHHGPTEMRRRRAAVRDPGVPAAPTSPKPDQPGGQVIGRPPMTCRWTWNTVWLASGAGVEHQPVAGLGHALGPRDLARRRQHRPARAGSASASAAACGWWARGTTTTCVLACGSMSRKANVDSVSCTTVRRDLTPRRSCKTDSRWSRDHSGVTTRSVDAGRNRLRRPRTTQYGRRRELSLGGCRMGCLFALFAGIFPRVGLFIVWILRPNLVDAAFSTWIFPLLGIIFLPFTTLIYVFLYTPGRALSGWEWFWTRDLRAVGPLELGVRPPPPHDHGGDHDVVMPAIMAQCVRPRPPGGRSSPGSCWSPRPWPRGSAACRPSPRTTTDGPTRLSR